mmetsp:Transcript_8481/g.25678  ORF Transcript_8481/g.25678 Transcript_8481/m.25678 type:complete len:313 (-) Transcript_8481:188-1126(-)
MPAASPSRLATPLPLPLRPPPSADAVPADAGASLMTPPPSPVRLPSDASTRSTSPSLSADAVSSAASSTSRMWSPAASWKPATSGWKRTNVPFSSRLYVTVTGPAAAPRAPPHRLSATRAGSCTVPSAALNSSRPACVDAPPGVRSSKCIAPLRGASWSMRCAPTDAGKRTLSLARRIPRLATAASSSGTACSVALKYTPLLCSVSCSCLSCARRAASSASSLRCVISASRSCSRRRCRSASSRSFSSRRRSASTRFVWSERRLDSRARSSLVPSMVARSLPPGPDNPPCRRQGKLDPHTGAGCATARRGSD